MNKNEMKQSRKRKRTFNTIKEQYETYLSMLENDYAFRSGTINPTLGHDYLNNKWEELSNKLNSFGNGPQLTREEWKKRFADWKYQTRAKYRKKCEHRAKTGSGPQSEIVLTELEERALSVWGKIVVTGDNNITSYDGLECNSNENNNILIEIGDNITYSDIIENPIEYNNDIENEVLLIEDTSERTEKTCPKKVKFSHEEIPSAKNKPSTSATSTKKYSRVKPLCILTEKLLENNNESTKCGSEFNKIMQQFTEDYIRVEREKIEMEKLKIRFEVAKLKILNPEFEFDV